MDQLVACTPHNLEAEEALVGAFFLDG